LCYTWLEAFENISTEHNFFSNKKNHLLPNFIQSLLLLSSQNSQQFELSQTGQWDLPVNPTISAARLKDFGSLHFPLSADPFVPIVLLGPILQKHIL
jgi:hypothetical protein